MIPLGRRKAQEPTASSEEGWAPSHQAVPSRPKRSNQSCY